MGGFAGTAPAHHRKLETTLVDSILSYREVLLCDIYAFGSRSLAC